MSSRPWITDVGHNRKGLPPLPSKCSVQGSQPFIYDRNKDSPFRSKSLDVLLNTNDEPEELKNEFPIRTCISTNNNTLEQLTPISRSCNNILDPQVSVNTTQLPSNTNISESTDFTKNSNYKDAKCDSSNKSKDSQHTSLTTLSNDSKKKRNFMDKCMSKVKSLVRK